MDIDSIRIANLQSAVTIAGSIRKLAELAETSPSYISQCLSANIKKSLGSSMARRIENALGFEKGWMDKQHEEGEVKEDSPNPSLYLLLEQLGESERDDISELVYMMIRKRKIIDKYK